jgi:AraC-like DNA-binding protein
VPKAYPGRPSRAWPIFRAFRSAPKFAFHLLRSDGAAVGRGAVREEDTAIQLATRFIRENATRSLSVEDVARHAGMSPSHFAHRFSAIARVSPMRYVKHVRLELARELMIGANVRVGEAAARVGYESSSHFTRDFKLAYHEAVGEIVESAPGSPI